MSALALLALSACAASARAPGPVAPPPASGPATWPQAGGPDRTFPASAAGAPVQWSVAANENVLWGAPLPGVGQGGIAVWGDSLFLTTYPPFTGEKAGAAILGHAIDRAN